MCASFRGAVSNFKGAVADFLQPCRYINRQAYARAPTHSLAGSRAKRRGFCARAQAPKQGIAGALHELGSTQQEQAAQQQGIAVRPGKQAQPAADLPPPPPRPAQVAPQHPAMQAGLGF